MDNSAKIYGISKMVYSITYPETRIIKDKIWATRPHSMYERTHNKYQDDMHLSFFEEWIKWTGPVLDFNESNFKYIYPICGSSEGIQESIAFHATNEEIPVIHVFDGEYEGYENYAKHYNIQIIKHNRNNYQTSVFNSCYPGDRFYISQPSSKDGNVWKGFGEFLEWMNINLPEVKIMLDLCYVGTVANPYYINTDFPNIDTIFFSLSKVFGVFYDRIGGMFSKNPYPNLNENIWLKNLLSLKLGTELLKEYEVYELPKKYQYAQKRAVEIVGRNICASDVIILGNKISANDELDKYLLRGTGESKSVRYCLSPTIDEIIYPL